eukprot:Tbor_TRINITY_DN5458_c0_g1::TRINITY_DN5458_c0_g1_i3::g.24595::m.24595
MLSSKRIQRGGITSTNHSGSSKEPNSQFEATTGTLSVEQRLRIVKRNRGRCGHPIMPVAVDPPSEHFPSFEKKLVLTDQDKELVNIILGDTVETLLFNG